MVGSRPLLWMLGILATCGVAHATESEKLSCIDQNLHAQRLERDGKLRAAHAELVACAEPSCPSAVRGDCATILARVDRSLPSIAVVARDARGQDLSSVRIAVDAEPAIDHVAGRSFAIDPGPHLLHGSVGDQHRDLSITVVTGQKDRPLAFDFSAATASASSRPFVPALAWIWGGVAVVSAGAFVGFGLSARSAKSDLDSRCAPTRTCEESDVSSMRRRFVVADVFAVLAGAALVGAVVTTIVWPRSEARVDVAFTGRGAVVEGRF